MVRRVTGLRRCTQATIRLGHFILLSGDRMQTLPLRTVTEGYRDGGPPDDLTIAWGPADLLDIAENTVGV